MASSEPAGLAIRSFRRMVLLSLDIKGAYDRVWHPGLLHKLAMMGIPGELLGWVCSFLADRVATIGVGTVRETRQLHSGVPQGSPLSCILFLVFVNDLLTDLASVEEASAQAFADDVTAWWIVGRDEDSDRIGQRVSAVVSRWARRWKAEFSPSKCLIMGIDRFHPPVPEPTFVLDGTSLTCVPVLRCLGVWIDSRLTWLPHITRVSEQALARLRGIYRGVGTLWGFHPIVVRRFVEASILPLLFYAAPAWCTGLTSDLGKGPLDRALRQCAVTTMGLYRTVSGDAARFLAGLLPAATYVRQRVVDFYVRHLSYGVDLLAEGPPPRAGGHTTSSSFTTCDDYLRSCLRPFLGRTPPDGLTLPLMQRVEVRRFWTTDPSAPRWDPLPSILEDRDASIDRIRTGCLEASVDDLWIFTDGSVCGRACGAAAVLFDGTASDGQTSSVSFQGFHSSTQAELVALRLGCAMTDRRPALARVTFVCDSQSALKGVRRHLHYLELALAARDDLARLHDRGADVRLWWTPSHVGLRENDLADAAARAAAQRSLQACDGEVVPSCRAHLKTVLWHHAEREVDRQWRSGYEGSAAHVDLPHFSRDLRWMSAMSRLEVALVSQFISGHYRTGAYLHRFGLRGDGHCQWCGAEVDDCAHRLLQCPQFTVLRQRLRSAIAMDTRGAHDWTWEFLVGSGRRYLAHFLRAVRAAERE